MQEQRETIHQLTHHVRVLRTQLQVAQEQQQLGLLDSMDGLEGTQGYTAAGGMHFDAPHSHYPHTPAAAQPSGAVDTHGHLPHYHYQQQQQQQYPVPPYEGSVLQHPHTLRTAQTQQTQQTHTHSAGSGGGAHHLSRTVPLTPLSVGKTTTRTSLSQTLPAHYSSGDRDRRAVPGLDAVYGSHTDAAHIIRASIPPAPWEQA